ncbi:MAG: phosphoribosylglycinamide formyltransferase [Nitrospirae bacterium]|nr:phosphoribosylglycinamide formyltransferase [Nitrospirota bacterium]
MGRVSLGILASGRGSNFQAIVDEIEAGKLNASVKLLIVDNAGAYARERAKRHSIEHLFLDAEGFPTKEEFFSRISEEFRKRGVQLVVLAGFMRVVRRPLLDAFPLRIMNIHPALLPCFPGLHGQKQAVEYGVKLSGCTVHFVDEGMDTGPIIIQAAVPLAPDDTEESLSERILELEHKIFPEAIRLFSEGRLKVEGRVVRITGHRVNGEAIVNPPLS